MMVSFPTSLARGGDSRSHGSKRWHTAGRFDRPRSEDRRRSTQQDVSAGRNATIQKIVKTGKFLPNSPFFIAVDGA